MRGKTLSAAQERAALVGAVCSSGKGGGEKGCHPIRAQRRGEVTWGGGQRSAPGLQTPTRGCQMARSSSLHQHWDTAGL